MGVSHAPVLITGGAGYLGSVLTSHLLGRGCRVRVLDNCTFGGGALLAHTHNPNFEFLIGDVRQAGDVDRSLKNVRAVIHLAAIVGDPACRDNPQLAVSVNRDGANLLLEHAQAAGVERFIFASTCSNYGKTPESGGYVNESSPLNPVSLYAELKVEFEQSLLNINRESFTPVCLRFATAYGLSPRMRFDLTLNEFVMTLAAGKRLEIYGEQFWRPFCHTFDIASAVLAALEADAHIVANRAFNVGDTSENFQKKTLAEKTIAQLPEASEQVAYVSRAEDPRDYRVNCDRIKNELGFSITHRIDDGIAEIIAALKQRLIVNPSDRCYYNYYSDGK